MAILPQTIIIRKVTYNLRDMVNTTKQRDKKKKTLSKTMSVKTRKGKDSTGKIRYGIYTAWKK